MEKKKSGRPSKYDRVDLAQVGRLSLLGFTDKEFADFYEKNQQLITGRQNTLNFWRP